MKLKSTISTLLCAMIIFALFPFSVFAVDDDYATISYYTILAADDTAVSTIDGVEPVIECYGVEGYAYGFETELEGGNIYEFSVTIRDIDDYAYGLECGAAILVSDFTGDFSSDCINVGTEYTTFEDVITAKSSVLVDESGTYRLLGWSSAWDTAGNDVYGADHIKVEYTIRKIETAVVRIESAEDLCELEKNAGDDLYYDKQLNIFLDANIDMAGSDFGSINAFLCYGVLFAGNSHTISNLGTALFCEASSVVISDLFVECDVLAENVYEFSDFGALVGEANEVIIMNTEVKGIIDIEGSDYVSDVGGLVGDVGVLSVFNSYVNVDMFFGECDDVAYIGGIAGYTWSFTGLNDVVWEGEIIMTAHAIEPYCLGGLVGLDEGDNSYYTNCAAIGKIKLDEPLDPDNYFATSIGGLIGETYSNGWYVNCNTDIEITAPGVYHVGGMVGLFADENADNSFYNCCTEGEIVSGYNVGGFAGSSYGECRYYNCYSICDITATNYIGGFIGRASEYDSFTNCYATGTVTRDGNALADAGTGTFLGSCQKEISFTNVFAAEDSVYGACGDYPGDTSGITVVDFTDDEQVADMIDPLNTLVNAYNVAVLLDYELEHWSDTARNEDNGPVFEEETQYLLGDANCDGVINQYDYILVKRHYFGTRYLTETEMLTSDVNEDGTVNQYDYILIKRHYFGTYVIGG